MIIGATGMTGSKPVPGQVMIDIETMSTRTNAMVLSVAAVNFKLDVEACVVGSKKLWVLDTRSQLWTRHVDPETQKWWAKQPPAAKTHLLQDPTPLPDFLLEFRGVVGAQDEVWAHGTVFDMGILENLYAEYGLEPPWKRYDVIRDVRTFVRCFPVQNRLCPDEVIKNHKEHDPVDDCVRQIWSLWEHWPK